MLNKNCDLRPLAKDIIRTPFVVGHLNDLLSYTVKKKDGGGNFNNLKNEPAKIRLSNAILPQGNFAVVNNNGINKNRISDEENNVIEPIQLDAEVAEKQIEHERNRQREEQIRMSKDSKEAKVRY